MNAVGRPNRECALWPRLLLTLLEGVLAWLIADLSLRNQASALTCASLPLLAFLSYYKQGLMLLTATLAGGVL